ncbi:unnamed protein product [Clonostachys byssicola]|uniref:Uncharacterized protein n=1 Tax=Clonostachys byssicola TaxID=160290 RepID=A0A9N9UFP8_9HYPO|nr:unnamed protein product [Clonostachys byssicola]
MYQHLTWRFILSLLFLAIIWLLGSKSFDPYPGVGIVGHSSFKGFEMLLQSLFVVEPYYCADLLFPKRMAQATF